MATPPSPHAPPAVAPSPAAAPAARPTGVTVLGVLAFVGALFALIAGFGMFAVGAFAGAMGAAAGGAEGGMVGMFGALGAIMGVFLIAYAVFLVFVGIGLLGRKRWAWYATLVGVAIQLLMGITSLLSFDLFSALLGLGIGGFVGWYLLSPSVQAWFSVSHNTPWKYSQAS